MITEPGLFELDAADYLRDPAPEPSLNNSTIGPLIKCPAMARFGHPRLNPTWEPKQSTQLDVGSVAHALLLGKGREIQVFDAPDWNASGMGKGAKTKLHEERDQARAAGKIPVLGHDYDRANAMLRAARNQLQDFEEPDPFDLSTGKCELGLFWTEATDVAGRPAAPIWCRNLIDRLRSDLPVWEVWDYKTTDTDIDPEGRALGSHVVDMGYDTQVAMQERGLSSLFPAMAGRIKFRWLFQQAKPPHLISVVEPDPATLLIAHKKVQYAIDRWRECLTTNRWPGYPPRITTLRHNEFLAARWLEREVAEFDAGHLEPPPAPTLKRLPGRPRKPKPNRPVTDLSGG